MHYTSMFNLFNEMPKLFLLSLLSCFTIYTIRHSFFKKLPFVFLYHLCLFIVLFIMSIGGGQVINDALKRLDQFIILEKDNKLEYAKNNLKNYDSMFQIDLQQFNNSSEFKDYILKTYSCSVDQAESVSIGWIFSLVTECFLLFNWILHQIKHLSSDLFRKIIKLRVV